MNDTRPITGRTEADGQPSTSGSAGQVVGPIQRLVQVQAQSKMAGTAVERENSHPNAAETQDSTQETATPKPRSDQSGVTVSHQCLDQLREELTCSICLELCTRPSTTPCGHSFCRQCIKQALRMDQERRCPKCRVCLPDQPLAVHSVLWNIIQMLFPAHYQSACENLSPVTPLPSNPFLRVREQVQRRPFSNTTTFTMGPGEHPPSYRIDLATANPPSFRLEDDQLLPGVEDAIDMSLTDGDQSSASMVWRHRLREEQRQHRTGNVQTTPGESHRFWNRVLDETSSAEASPFAGLGVASAAAELIERLERIDLEDPDSVQEGLEGLTGTPERWAPPQMAPPRLERTYSTLDRVLSRALGEQIRPTEMLRNASRPHSRRGPRQQSDPFSHRTSDVRTADSAGAALLYPQGDARRSTQPRRQTAEEMAFSFGGSGRRPPRSIGDMPRAHPVPEPMGESPDLLTRSGELGFDGSYARLADGFHQVADYWMESPSLAGGDFLADTTVGGSSSPEDVIDLTDSPEILPLMHRSGHEEVNIRGGEIPRAHENSVTGNGPASSSTSRFYDRGSPVRGVRELAGHSVHDTEPNRYSNRNPSAARRRGAVTRRQRALQQL